MITLTPITDPTKLQEYFRFRYRIYNESRLKRFVADADGIDRDAYDDHAHHYGWYMNGQLAGCVRFVEPNNSVKPLPMFTHLTDEAALDAVCMYIAMRRAHGQRMIEASRFCLAPEHRGLRTAREFVLAMVMTMRPLGFEQGLFDADEAHASLYKGKGFDLLDGTTKLQGRSSVVRAALMRDDHKRPIPRHVEVKRRMGLLGEWNMKNVA